MYLWARKLADYIQRYRLKLFLKNLDYPAKPKNEIAHITVIKKFMKPSLRWFFYFYESLVIAAFHGKHSCDIRGLYMQKLTKTCNFF
jgi:hypothetical protein